MKLRRNYRSKKSLIAENNYLSEQVRKYSPFARPQIESTTKKVVKLGTVIEIPENIPFDVAKKSILRNLIEEADQYVAYGTDKKGSNGKHILTGELTIVKE